jgi:hypothetical protein
MKTVPKVRARSLDVMGQNTQKRAENLGHIREWANFDKKLIYLYSPGS